MSEAFLQPLREFGAKARFIGRLKGVDVDTDRLATLSRLEPKHRTSVQAMGYSWGRCWRAEQVHGAEIAVVRGDGAKVVEGVDGLVSDDPSVVLGIYVADCGVVYLLDKKTRAFGLVHSGKKGTEGEIVKRALAVMAEEYGSKAEDVLAVLGPCIRPPAYEVDFAAEIQRQCQSVGVGEYRDCGICTSSDLDSYYSYRIEMGATGRMLALLGRKS